MGKKIVVVFGSCAIFALVVLSNASVFASTCSSIGPMFKCSNGDTCSNSGSTCVCGDSDIADGLVCVDPVGDGKRAVVVGYNQLCSADPDGCACYDTTNAFKVNVNMGELCIRDLPSSLPSPSTPITPAPVTYSYGGGGGGSWTEPVCTMNVNLVCTNDTWQKKASTYCVGGDLGKSCVVDLTGIILGVKDLTVSGFWATISTIKSSSVVSEKEIEGVKIKFITPLFSNKILKNVILSLNDSIAKAVQIKLAGISNPTYYVEHYENVTGSVADMKLSTYKEIGSLMKTYNDFVACFFAITDLKKTEYLPIGQYMLKKFLIEYLSFKK